MLDLLVNIYFRDNQYYFNLLYLFLFFSMLFSVISRVFRIYNTIYKVPNKLNNKIKYNTPSSR